MRPRRRPLPSRCQAGSAAQPGESLKARIAGNFDQLFVTMEGKQYISVEKVGGRGRGLRKRCLWSSLRACAWRASICHLALLQYARC